MFTGLVEIVGRVARVSGDNPRALTIRSRLPNRATKVGDSVAIDGCCLTVVKKGTGTLTFEAATETLDRTTLGALRAGDAVNLERALRLGDRLGGHLVTGHVDAVGRVRQRQRRGSALYLTIDVPPELSRLVATRGSITVAGVSLTVTAVGERAFSVGLIPFTLEATTLGALAVGGSVNLEADLLARYVARLLAATSLTGTA